MRPGRAGDASGGQVRARDNLRRAHADEDDARETDRAGLSDQGEPRSLHGHSMHHRQGIPILRRTHHPGGQEAGLRNGSGLRDQNGSGNNERRRADCQVPAGD